jgi:hypothetical protein
MRFLRSMGASRRIVSGPRLMPHRQVIASGDRTGYLVCLDDVRRPGPVDAHRVGVEKIETVGDVDYWAEHHVLGPDRHGLIWLQEDAFATGYAQHAAPVERALRAATQRPCTPLPGITCR